MSAAKHTPGPWALAKDGSADFKNETNCIACADGTLIVYGQANDADARLIAAAPELLAALQNLENEFGVSGDGWPDSRFNKARAAIAKATGVQA